MAVTDPDKGANGVSAFMVHADDEGFTVGAKERKMGIKGSPTAELYFENCCIPGDRMIGEPGTGLKTALKTLTTPARPLGHKPSALRKGHWTSRSPTRRSASSSAGRFRAFRPFNSNWRKWR